MPIPDWWGGEVGIPYLINRVIGEQAVALQSIQAAEVDYTYLHGDLFTQIPDTSNLQWEIFPQMSVKFMALNWADPTAPGPAYDDEGNLVDQPPHPIFSDRAVRKAVAMGYSKQRHPDDHGRQRRRHTAYRRGESWYRLGVQP